MRQTPEQKRVEQLLVEAIAANDGLPSEEQAVKVLGQYGEWAMHKGLPVPWVIVTPREQLNVIASRLDVDRAGTLLVFVAGEVVRAIRAGAWDSFRKGDQE